MAVILLMKPWKQMSGGFARQHREDRLIAVLKRMPKKPLLRLFANNQLT
jgi:hypothetical protein